MYALTFYSLVLSCERANYLRVSLSYCPPAYLHTITYSPHSLHTHYTLLPSMSFRITFLPIDIYLTFLLDWHWTRLYKYFLQNNDNTRVFPLPFLLFCICLLSLLFLIFLNEMSHELDLTSHVLLFLRLSEKFPTTSSTLYEPLGILFIKVVKYR